MVSIIGGHGGKTHDAGTNQLELFHGTTVSTAYTRAVPLDFVLHAFSVSLTAIHACKLVTRQCFVASQWKGKGIVLAVAVISCFANARAVLGKRGILVADVHHPIVTESCQLLAREALTRLEGEGLGGVIFTFVHALPPITSTLRQVANGVLDPINAFGCSGVDSRFFRRGTPIAP